MKVTTCDLQGLLIIEPDVFGDNRGYFMESWNLQRYRDAGIDFDFVQDNFSLSRRGTLRGLHFQNPVAGTCLEIANAEPAQFADADAGKSEDRQQGAVADAFRQWHYLILLY